MNKICLVPLAAGLLIALQSQESFAGTDTATLLVTANVAASCNVATTPVYFGTYTGTSALTAQGTVSVTCTGGTGGAGAYVIIQMDKGSSGSSISQRKLKDSNNKTLTYNLYQPNGNTPGATCAASPTTIWGDTASTQFYAAPITSSSAVTYNICGSMPASQTLTGIAGGLSDTVNVTINF
ncbi:spore coat U domain-containing protein [soil metagenome]